MPADDVAGGHPLDLGAALGEDVRQVAVGVLGLVGRQEVGELGEPLDRQQGVVDEVVADGERLASELLVHQLFGRPRRGPPSRRLIPVLISVSISADFTSRLRGHGLLRPPQPASPSRGGPGRGRAGARAACCIGPRRRSRPRGPRAGRRPRTGIPPAARRSPALPNVRAAISIEPTENPMISDEQGEADHPQLAEDLEVAVVGDLRLVDDLVGPSKGTGLEQVVLRGDLEVARSRRPGRGSPRRPATPPARSSSGPPGFEPAPGSARGSGPASPAARSWRSRPQLSAAKSTATSATCGRHRPARTIARISRHPEGDQPATRCGQPDARRTEEGDPDRGEADQRRAAIERRDGDRERGAGDEHGRRARSGRRASLPRRSADSSPVGASDPVTRRRTPLRA